MVGLLLFISFLLHAVAFYWIFQLKKRLQETSEVEDIFSVYMDEMKEENDQLIRRLQEMETEETFVENKPVLPKTQIETVSSSENPVPQESYSPPIDSNGSQDRIDSSVEAQALFLAEQDIEVEEIAKRLGRGKGEIELLLRLAKRKS